MSKIEHKIDSFAGFGTLVRCLLDIPFSLWIGAPLLLMVLLIPDVCLSSESTTNTANSSDIALSTSTEDPLLMFWASKDLQVQTATRNDKPISQVAENMTVITAKDIADMNAHTVTDVLNRVTGVFVGFQGQDFDGTALAFIQGGIHATDLSRYALVLLDGIVMNSGEANAGFFQIPVSIIKRIEIIKGPASSVWGSSLGGVINIITKDTGDSQKPTGSVSASYGKSNSRDYNADVAGKVGDLGYYLYAGGRNSDGLVNNDRFIDKYSLYSKFSLPISHDVMLGFSAGYNNTRSSNGAFYLDDVRGVLKTPNLFATLSLDAALTNDLKLKLNLHSFREDFSSTVRTLGLGFYSIPPYYVENAGDFISSYAFTGNKVGGSAQLIYTSGLHTAILGTDMTHETFDSKVESGTFYQLIGAPAEIKGIPTLDKWAIFLNDTIALGKLSVTPGIRYDYNAITGSFTSPSLGITYHLADKTLLRGSVARGFTIPPLVYSSVGNVFLDPNPKLTSESVWSYQAGIETKVTDYIWLKATGFYHDIKNTLLREYYAGGPAGCVGTQCNDIYENKGDLTRKGFELEAETVAIHNISLKTGVAYVKTETEADNIPVQNIYSFNVSAKYDDKKSLMAELFGYYTYWNMDSSADARDNTVIWDFNLRKKIYSTETIDTEIFMAVHNIFNGYYYTAPQLINPRRWAEVGMRFTF